MTPRERIRFYVQCKHELKQRDIVELSKVRSPYLAPTPVPSSPLLKPATEIPVILAYFAGQRGKSAPRSAAERDGRMNFTFTAAIQTTAKSPQPCGVQLTDMLPLCLIQILSLVANALAALAIWRLPGLETNKNHLVVRTLIISDLLIPLPMLPFSIASYLSCGWLGGAVACDVTAFLSTTLLSWSVFIVFVLCLLRFVAVKHPLWYRHNVTYTKVKIALFVTLLWACLHLVLPSVGVGKFRLYEKGFYCALDLTPVQPRERVLVYLVLVEGVVSTALLFYSGAVIISALFRRKRRVSQQLSPSHSRRLSTVQLVSRYHEEFATLTVVIVVLFCVCYGPFLVSSPFVGY